MRYVGAYAVQYADMYSKKMKFYLNRLFIFEEF
jgi:hypothetical protein